MERGQFAKGQETVVTVPDDVPPKKVETAPGAAPVEVRHVARAEDPREGTEADDRVLTLLVGVLHAVRKEAFNLRRLPGPGSVNQCRLAKIFGMLRLLAETCC